jgi:hypothetical protein
VPAVRLRILGPASPDSSPHGYHRYNAVTIDPPERGVIVTNLSQRYLAPGRQVTAELAAVLPTRTLIFMVRVEDFPTGPVKRP